MNISKVTLLLFITPKKIFDCILLMIHVAMRPNVPLILFCEDGVCIYRLPRLSGPNAAKLPVYILDRAEPEILRSKFVWKNVRPNEI